MNDIALIRLLDQVSFGDFISPACLQIDLNDEHANTKIIAAGWGSTSTERKNFNIVVKNIL